MNHLLLKTKNKLKIFAQFKRMNPHIYWDTLLRVFLVVIFILIIFSFYLLYQINKQQIFQVIPKSEGVPSLINEKLLNSVKESFNNKEVKQKEIREGLQSYQDPSK
ncbi:MAG TPA: hypothetical protein VK153_00905 [Candidatus Paceibacterota bacterium]|nr:hypothetical protein [Candidatus Paceibacterota bacterium]